MKIILASASPRRLSLLSARGYDIKVVTSDFDESAVFEKNPKKLVMRLSEGKGRAVAKDCPDDTVLSADTVVCLRGKILGKPKSRQEAFDMLMSLSGNTHTVYTGVCIYKNSKCRVFYDKASVTFHPLTKKQIDAYIDSGSPFDKAGGYGIQDDMGISFVKKVSGDLSCVIGLPMGKVIKHLQKIKGENIWTLKN